MDSDTLAYPGLKEIVIASKIKARNIHTSNWRIIYLAGRYTGILMQLGLEGEYGQLIISFS